MPVHVIEAVEAPQLRATLKGHEDSVWQVAWAPDGKTLATLSIVKGEVKLWNVAERKERATLRSGRWDGTLGEYVLDWDDVRTAEDPYATALEFARSAFRHACVVCGWDPALAASADGTPPPVS